jgi:hypothetical protein
MKNIQYLIIGLILLIIVVPGVPILSIYVVKLYTIENNYLAAIYFPCTLITGVSFIYSLIFIYHGVKDDFNWR